MQQCISKNRLNKIVQVSTIDRMGNNHAMTSKTRNFCLPMHVHRTSNHTQLPSFSEKHNSKNRVGNVILKRYSPLYLLIDHAITDPTNNMSGLSLV